MPPPTPFPCTTKPVRNSKKPSISSLATLSNTTPSGSSCADLNVYQNYKYSPESPQKPGGDADSPYSPLAHYCLHNEEMVASCVKLRSDLSSKTSLQRQLEHNREGSNLSGPVFLGASWLHLIRGRVRSLKCVVRAPSCQTFWRVRLIAHRLPGLFVWYISNKLS